MESFSEVWTAWMSNSEVCGCFGSLEKAERTPSFRKVPLTKQKSSRSVVASFVSCCSKPRTTWVTCQDQISCQICSSKTTMPSIKRDPRDPRWFNSWPNFFDQPSLVWSRFFMDLWKVHSGAEKLPGFSPHETNIRNVRITPFWRRKNIYPSPWIQWIQSLADRSRPRGRLLRLIDLMYPVSYF